MRRQQTLKESHHRCQVALTFEAIDSPSLEWGIQVTKPRWLEYYWEYGVSPFQEDHQNTLQKQEQQKQGGGIGDLERENEESGANIEVIGENNTNVSDLKSNHRCLFVGCKLKAMALTSFCHLHILSDAKQKLYKP
ncbi:hypothetical protein Peur_026120 [Populus x canadensis]